MGNIPSPEDRPDPNERSTAVRARVPDHVTGGHVSTGVVVVTGATEFVLDFVRNLPRPSIVVARIVLPHVVMPQFVDALQNNVNLYRQRFGELEPPPVRPILPPEATSQSIVSPQASSIAPEPRSPRAEPTSPNDSPEVNEAGAGGLNPSRPSESPERGATSHLSANPSNPAPQPPPSQPPPQVPPPSSGSVTRHASPQEVYDELKIKDELLSGTYANAVMIGHGPHEFCFDFITNFYPQSAVSCRVYLSAGHVARLLDSIRTAWEQLRPRLGGQPPA